MGDTNVVVCIRCSRLVTSAFYIAGSGPFCPQCYMIMFPTIEDIEKEVEEAKP